jgi:hypothetical protein
LSELSFYKPLGGWDQITALCFKYLDSECTYVFVCLSRVKNITPPPPSHTTHGFVLNINPLNAELNPICHLLALLGDHPILHVSRIRVNN